MAVALTIGNFDGVHLGHRDLLTAARERVGEAGHVVAVTFDPPPAAVLRPGAAPPALLTPRRREAWLQEAGADEVVTLRPDTELLLKSAEAFIGDLHQQHGFTWIVEGPDFRFGHKRRGDLDLLRDLGRRSGFEVEVRPGVRAVLGGGWSVPISSSMCRWLIGRGRVAEAAALLGRPHEVCGTVVRGEQRGRQLGYPTANVEPDRPVGPAPGLLMPADGVYAAEALLADGTCYPAAVSIGSKATFGGRGVTVEAHLVTGSQKPIPEDGLYGDRLTLHLRRWIRDQARFPGVETLLDQLSRDTAAV